MDLDEMKDAWQAQHRSLELRLDHHLLRSRTLGRAETALRRLTLLTWIETGMDLALLLAIGSFMADHWREPRFLLPAALLHLFVIGFGAVGVRQLVGLSRVDLEAPVLAIQRAVGALRVERARATRWVLLGAPLLWVPMLIVALRAAGVDAYRVFAPAWLLANAVFGAAVLIAGIGLSRRYAGRLDASPRLRRLADHLAGTHLRAAACAVEELRRFESDREVAR